METPSGLPDVGLYDWLIQEHILLAYNGEIDGELIDMLVELAEKVLKKASSRLKARKKIINILIESLQNSFHYAQYIQNSGLQDTKKAIRSPFLILCKEPIVSQKIEEDTNTTPEEDDNYWIITGNWIDNENAQKLQTRIRQLEALNEEELQEQYLKSLNKDELPTAGGAGLGLIDIMRRTNRQVFFEFKEANQDFSVFTLKMKVH